MCGIIAFNATRDIRAETLAGLCRLEYRGYDSFGVACLNGSVSVVRDVGAPSEKLEMLQGNGLPATRQAIGHTRWATHGKVTVPNAHPHRSHDGKITLVHNGVIENHHELREMLRGLNMVFHSETDTEVIANLFALHYSHTGDLKQSVIRTRSDLEGEYALVISCTDHPEVLIGMRQQSPLAVGMLDFGSFMCSDPAAIAGHAGEIRYLENGDIAFASAGGLDLYRVVDDALVPVERPRVALDPSNEADELGEYPHYMLKEIHESPNVITRAAAMTPAELAPAIDLFDGRAIVLTAAGSSYYVCLMAQLYFGHIAGRYARCHPADEFLNISPIGEFDTLLTVSQSGETFDTLEVMHAARAAGAKNVAINNVANSTAQRSADVPILQNAGREICVLSTKSIISQIAIVYRMALALAERAGKITPTEHGAMNDALASLPGVLNSVITDNRPQIAKIAKGYRWIENWFFLGRNVQFPVALESSLKFKEVSYLHAEGMPSGFLKHGTISLIDEKFFTVAFIPHKATDPESFGFTVSSLHEIAARGGNIIGFGHDPETAFEAGLFEAYVQLPTVSKWLDPLLELAAGQIFAYECAVRLGRNIDKPRALAKAVTVR